MKILAVLTKMVTILLGWELCFRVFRNPIPEDGSLSLELSRLVLRINLGIVSICLADSR